MLLLKLRNLISVMAMVFSIKESLQNAIADLSEEDCVQVMELVQHLQHKDSQLSKRLVSDQTFLIPSSPISFQVVQPISGEGISASEQLLEDRS